VQVGVSVNIFFGVKVFPLLCVAVPHGPVRETRIERTVVNVEDRLSVVYPALNDEVVLFHFLPPM
jgi:hypothetical protein